MNEFISIDPGKTGAVVYWWDDEPCQWYQFAAQRKGERFYWHEDLECFDHILSNMTEGTIVIEALRDFGIGQQSIARNNTTAANWGALYHLGVYWGHEVEIVTAAAWKKRLSLGPDKGISLDMARDLYPMCADSLKLKKNHDLAEALLIGHDYLQRQS